MADEARISGINWRETFPFTNLFRSFRIAIHPSKLALGLAALVCLYIGGRILDRIWPVSHRAVPNEVLLYQEFSNIGGSSKAFDRERADARRDLERAFASQLIAHGVFSDAKQADDAARNVDRSAIRGLQDKAVAERNKAVEGAHKTYNEAYTAAGKIQQKRERNEAYESALKTRDSSIAAAYQRYAATMEAGRAIKGRGIFAEFFEYETAQVVRVVNGVTTFNWLGGFRKDANAGVVKGIVNFFAVGPLWLMWEHTVYFILFGLLFLSVWAVFGGAIARIAAVHVARDEKLSVRAALSFSAGKFLSFVSAPLIPIIIILIVGLVPLVAGALASIPFIGPVLNLLMSALFVLLLAAGFVMALVMIGLVAGLNLMYPTIAVEGSDSFDAISRSFSYVYARPWRMLLYTAIAIIYGALTYLFVRFFIYLMLALTHGFVGAGMWASAPSAEPLWPTMWAGPGAAGTLSYQPGFDVLRWDQSLAAVFIAFWVYLLVSVLGAFAISFYFSANTIIYYLMRNEVDATEMDDVYLEQSDEDFADAGTLTPPPTVDASGAGAAPAAPAAPEAPVTPAAPPVQTTDTIVSTPEAPKKEEEEKDEA